MGTVFLIGYFSSNYRSILAAFLGSPGAPWTWTLILFADMDIILNLHGMNE